MATIFLIDTKKVKDERKLNLARITLDRWAERQAGAAFLSAETDFILTDYNRNHRELDLLCHLLNCNGLDYRAIGNVDLQGLGEDQWKQTLNNLYHHINNKKGA